MHFDRRRARFVGFAIVWLGAAGAAQAWEPARVEPRVDNLDELLTGCKTRRAAAEAWRSHRASFGDGAAAPLDGAVAAAPSLAATTPAPPAAPDCTADAVLARLDSRPPAVWAITTPAAGEPLFATVNLPRAALLVSLDDGRSWHYRHLFLRGYNVDAAAQLRGLSFRHGHLAVATDRGLLLSADGGRTFTRALPGQRFSAVAISPLSRNWIVAGGDGTSYGSLDGGASWTALRFTEFTRALPTRNRYLTDHITSVEFDPEDPGSVYVGTGSHLYRFVLTSADLADGAWQAMEGDRDGRVFDDSTVYNVAIGERFMISTCNGVYYLTRRSTSLAGGQADVSWRKFRDGAFRNRRVGGPAGNLRSYFVSEDPDDRDRILVADFAGFYEGRSRAGAMRWKRVEELPYYAPGVGYPEYTAIAWTRDGDAVVGSRYRGIFVERRAPAATEPAMDRMPIASGGPAAPAREAVDAAAAVVSALQ